MWTNPKLSKVIIEKRKKQECIPVGCVPSAAVTVSPATHAPTAMHTPSLPTHAPFAMHAPFRHACPPPPVDRHLSQLLLLTVIKENSDTRCSLLCRSATELYFDRLHRKQVVLGGRPIKSSGDVKPRWQLSRGTPGEPAAPLLPGGVRRCHLLDGVGISLR